MGNYKDLIERREASMGELSKGHRLIAAYIIENYDKAAYMTASALGAEVGVSESTVVRFAIEMAKLDYQKGGKGIFFPSQYTFSPYEE